LTTYAVDRDAGGGSLSRRSQASDAAAISRTEDFFRKMGCPVCNAGVAPIKVVPEGIVSHLDSAGQTELGEDKGFGIKDAFAILDIAA